MLDSLFIKTSVRLRHREAPLLREREQYLMALLNQGYGVASLRIIASILLYVIRVMNLSQLRTVSPKEIRDAAQRWQADVEFPARKGAGSRAVYMFVNTATHWFRYHGLIDTSSATLRPFDLEHTRFIDYLKLERQYRPRSLIVIESKISAFLEWAWDRHQSLSSISLTDVDAFIGTKQEAGCRPATLASYLSNIKIFFRFCESQGWSFLGVSAGIRVPKVQGPGRTPKGPSWTDVRRLIAATSGSTPVELRAHAVILLCSIYALRASEIASLTLDDIDWISETFSLKRAKNGRVQRFPIQFEVGQAILDYLQQGRHHLPARNLFTTVKAPYKPIDSNNVSLIVFVQIKKMGIQSENKGPHSLRHACATQLLKKGASLRDIADFLGHRGMSTVSVYAKSDWRALQEVASFSLAGLK